MIATYIAGPVTKGDQFLNVRVAIMAGEELRMLVNTARGQIVPRAHAQRLGIPVFYSVAEVVAWRDGLAVE